MKLVVAYILCWVEDDVGLRRGVVGRVLCCVDAFVDLIAEVVVDRVVDIFALDV